MGTPSRGTHFCTNLSFFPPLDVPLYAFGWKKMPFCTILESLPLPNRGFVKLGGSDLKKTRTNRNGLSSFFFLI